MHPLRLYFVVGSIVMAWWCRDSQILSALFLIQADVVGRERLRRRFSGRH